jgi:hypothetical protein
MRWGWWGVARDLITQHAVRTFREGPNPLPHHRVVRAGQRGRCCGVLLIHTGASVHGTEPRGCQGGLPGGISGAQERGGQRRCGAMSELTPLHNAASTGNVVTIRRMVMEGMDVNVQAAQGVRAERVAGRPPRRRRGQGAAGKGAAVKGGAVPVHLPHASSGSTRRRRMQCRPPLLWPRRPPPSRSRQSPSLLAAAARRRTRSDSARWRRRGRRCGEQLSCWRRQRARGAWTRWRRRCRQRRSMRLASEKLAALVAEARELIEQARAAEAERGRVAAEKAAAAAAAVEAAERLRLEEEPGSTHAERAE